MDRKFYEKEIKKAQTINELVWIDCDYKEDNSLAWEDFEKLVRMSWRKRLQLEEAGDKYTRATKPSWR